ncbi:polysaccharide deacetylase family protein [Pseudorhodoferax sp. Leaf274]|uniref:polysaccharide deacetylase family protein n=1 Tax=Pseudorhodoferax sp. Leaf274 TaxID=1736318 RepID=UPI000703C27F|nr:polysaccharide deacetylase family protein [Pseudorhodoferax sp. Leaf274]KQP46234.1 polysaccharide deacetylase [Pseudorhodoferax sp. Leaf274]
MALDPIHLDYPMRRYGMDHDRYAWSMLTDRPPVRWPGGKPLAVWINVSLQHFPMNPQARIRLPGSMTMPHPDLRHFTLRDYGNRVGIHRFLRAFDAHGMRPSFAINAELALRYPALMRAIRERGDEVLGHSWSMDTPHAGGIAIADERALVQRSLATLRELSGQAVRGWLSPGKLQGPNTPELLKAEGIDYCADWVNDELPYRFHTAQGDLWNLPLATEIEDRFVVMDNLHAEASWAEQVIDAFELLLAEARAQGGRLLTLSLHPWVMGQPHRIQHLETVLRHIAACGEAWQAPPGAIVDAFAAQQVAA